MPWVGTRRDPDPGNFPQLRIADIDAVGAQIADADKIPLGTGDNAVGVGIGLPLGMEAPAGMGHHLTGQQSGAGAAVIGGVGPAPMMEDVGGNGAEGRLNVPCLLQRSYINLRATT